MLNPQDSHNRSIFSFGNPFRAISPKGSPARHQLPPDLINLLNLFEDTLASRMRKLMPKNKADLTSFDWMKSSMSTLCAIQGDIKNLISNLELPITSWDEMWIEIYLDTTVKLLDLCIAFSSEIMRLSQGNFFVQCAVYNLEHNASKQPAQARASFDGWKKSICGKNPRMVNCSATLNSIAETLDLPRGKTSGKGKVLMTGMNGVRVLTVFLCSVFATILSGDSKNMVELNVSESYTWAVSFLDLQAFTIECLKTLLPERKAAILNELNVVDDSVNKLYPLVESDVQNDEFKESLSDLRRKMERLSNALELLGKEVDGVFKMVMAGRDTLLGSLRSSTNLTAKSLGPYMKQQPVA